MSLPESSRCLVTGASDPTSIGYACAQALLRAGAGKVTIMGRNKDKVESAVATLSDSSSSERQTFHGVVGDLTKPESMADVVKETVGIMGGLDILVVSGGNGGSEYLGLNAEDPAAYRLMNDVGVLSPLFLAEAAAPELAKCQAGGTVVMVSSMAPQVPWPNTAPFNYAKAAQNNMIETLAFKYRTGNIRVNGVLPSCIHTGKLDVMAEKKNIDVDEYAKLRGDAHPMGRNGTPQDVANSVLFLASPASGFTTGELVKVDGGLHLSNWFNKPRMMAEFVGQSKKASC